MSKVGASHGPGVFTDEEFEQVARQVVSPDLNGFEFFVESHGTKFYRKYKEVLHSLSSLLYTYICIDITSMAP